MISTKASQIFPDSEDLITVNDSTQSGILRPHGKLKRWQWWVVVVFNICCVLVGQVVAVILARFYYDQGGKSKWLVTCLMTAGFPILFVPYLLTKESSSTPNSRPVVFLIYIAIGVLTGCDNVLYSVGLLNLSASTYSLICVTTLVFNAVFAIFINSQKFTILILNSVVVLSLSASLLAVNDDLDDETSGVTNGNYVTGYVATISASALYALLLCVTQLTFQRVFKKETFSVVLELQIYTSFFATCVSITGLFASGEWRSLSVEMDGFGKGGLAYVMTLVWAAVAWQVCAVSIVGLIFLVSSLFSNVVSTLSLALTPVAAMVVFHDKMNGIKIIAMLLGLWGVCSYIYQNYLDDLKANGKQANATGTVSSEVSTPLLLE